MQLRAVTETTLLRGFCCGVILLSVSITGSANAWAWPENTRRTRPPGLGKSANPQSHVTIIRKGTSSSKSKKAAHALVPRAKLTPQVRQKVDKILRETSLFRELPSLRFEVNPKVYLYFASHPDVAVSIWRTMGISKFHLKEKNPTLFTANGGDGTKGDIEVVFRGPGHILVICEGAYKNPWLFKPIKTRSLIHLQASFEKDKTGKTFVTHRLFLHVAFPSSTVKTASRLMSPVSYMILDRNFREISLFLNVMSRAMSRQPGWVERIAGRLDGVGKIRRKEMLDLTAEVYVAALKKKGKVAGRSPKGTVRKVNETRPQPLRKTAEGSQPRLRTTRVQNIRPNTVKK
jgi:hypothetical protein